MRENDVTNILTNKTVVVEQNGSTIEVEGTLNPTDNIEILIEFGV